uniref:Copia protein n=1 Tax=Cacopsylla melanoneura TaxID=428564 RepID=A0A8D8TIV6_9HEMI
MEESEKICNLLLSLPSSYEYVVSSLETLISQDNLTMDFVKRRLLDEELKRKKSDCSTSSGAIEQSSAFVSSNMNVRCYRCNQTGHIQRFCRSRISSTNVFQNNGHHSGNRGKYNFHSNSRVQMPQMQRHRDERDTFKNESNVATCENEPEVSGDWKKI